MHPRTMVDDEPLPLTPGACCVCGNGAPADPVAVGEDFEYRTSPDRFLAVRCRVCGLVYLDPRPSVTAFARIYPPTYHAFAFDEAVSPVVRAIRRRLETNRLSRWIGDASSSVLDVGCGDGFHLELLRARNPERRIAGVEFDPRAATRAREHGLDVRQAPIEDVRFDEPFDVALLVQTIEHLDDPPAALRAIRATLRPGGRLIVVTDNTRSLDRTWFAGRHWGGYHFPRHLQLFDKGNLARLAGRCGFKVREIETMVSPVNWTYSVRNALVDYGAPAWLYERFSLSSAPVLAAFTILDTLATFAGRGALLRAEFEAC